MFCNETLVVWSLGALRQTMLWTKGKLCDGRCSGAAIVFVWSVSAVKSRSYDGLRTGGRFSLRRKLRRDVIWDPEENNITIFL